MLRWSFEHLQDEQGGSVYLRLTTRPLEQQKREFTPELAAQAIQGGYWLLPPGDGGEPATVAAGGGLPEAIDAHRQILEDIPDAGLLVVTSADRLHGEWIQAQRTTVP